MLHQDALPPDLGVFGGDGFIAPAMGGLVIGQEVARQTKVAASLFAEKRSMIGWLCAAIFRIADGECLLVVEDVITRGFVYQVCFFGEPARAGRLWNLVREPGKGCAMAVAVLVRTAARGAASFGDVPHSFLCCCMDFPDLFAGYS